MRLAPLPVNEELRLQDLYAYQILDTEFEKDFDDLVELAAQVYGCPLAAINFVDRDRVWVKGRKGFELREVSRDNAFCAHTILEADGLQVSDLRADERFANHPMTTQALKIVFYAGMPIVSSQGYPLGAVCVMDLAPRPLTAEQTRGLQTIATIVSRLLELRLKNNKLKSTAAERLAFEKESTRALFQKQADQKNGIAVELHEHIAQELAAVHLGLSFLRDRADDPLVTRGMEGIARCLQSIRQLSYRMAPTTLSSLALSDVAQLMTQRFAREHGIAIHFSCQGSAKPPAGVAQLCTFALEGLLENARAHATCQNITVKLHLGKTLQLSVQDDGAGLDLLGFRQGAGLKQINALVNHYGGTLDLQSAPGEGFQASIQLPLSTTAPGLRGSKLKKPSLN